MMGSILKAGPGRSDGLPDPELATLLSRIEGETGLSFGATDGRLAAALTGRAASTLAGLHATDPAWLSFVFDLLVHETYFCRHPGQISVLRGRTLPELAAAARREGRGALAIWSASCSTGEEAWTIALAARDALAGSGTDFRIQASDLSEAALGTARRAIYRSLPRLGSFRGPPDALASAGLVLNNDSWRAPDDLRRHMTFFRHNIMDMPTFGPLDLVLCRNTFIYFSADAQRRAMACFASVLRPGGYLALGPAETPGADARFAPACGGEAMLFRREPDSAITAS